MTAASYVVPVVVALAFLFLYRSAGHYAPPGYGGPEPRENHVAALQILERGSTDMTFHATGYAYFTAAVYAVLPNAPISVLFVQILLLPVVVWSIGRLTAATAGDEFEWLGRLLAGLYYPLAYYTVAFSTIVPAFVFMTLFLALAVELLGSDFTSGRGLAAGLALGVAVCHRPYLALVGVFFSVAIWVATKDLKQALIRSLPVALVAGAMLVLMTSINPPEPGQLVRGSQGFNRGLLQGTYQYAARWWDWEWIEDERDRGFRDYREHLARIERAAGESYPHPVVQELLRQEGFERILSNPGNSVKKAVIGSLRLWVFIPTHLNSRPIKYILAAQDIALLLTAIAGFLVYRGRRGVRVLLSGALLVPIVFHFFTTVEPRYSLPGRGVELAFAAAGLVTLIGYCRGKCEQRNDPC